MRIARCDPDAVSMMMMMMIYIPSLEFYTDINALERR